jgi:protein-disulfide isomerase
MPSRAPLGVNGTPTFFVDGERLDRGWDAFTLMAAIRDRPRASQDRPHAG